MFLGTCKEPQGMFQYTAGKGQCHNSHKCVVGALFLHHSRCESWVRVRACAFRSTYEAENINGGFPE